MELGESQIYANLKQDNQQKFLVDALWKQDPHFFTTVRISALAAVRMAVHAESGGSQEVMGVLTGKIVGESFVVMDAYPLPVEATETRVNALGEAYEYMVQYLDNLKRVGRTENIVGWYHSHPGYGCWLSRIDIGTQAQNQTYQDPFLAIVIDPLKTLSSRRLEIGAFRTLPSASEGIANPQSEKRGSREDGFFSSLYYQLDLSFFRTKLDENLNELIWENPWTTTLAGTLQDHSATSSQIAITCSRLKKELARRLGQGETNFACNRKCGAFSDLATIITQNTAALFAEKSRTLMRFGQ